jgi:glycosyltransferase involved in cell wall biosynthesis
MKRLVYTHSIFHFGSTEEYVRQLIERLDRERFEPWLILPDDPSLGSLLELDRVVLVKPHVFGSAPRAVRALRRELRRLRPDLVHVVDVDPAALLAARLASVRRVVVTHHTPELPRRDNAVGRVLLRLGWATRPEVIFTSVQDRERFGGARAHVVPLGIDLERFAPRSGDGRVRRALGLKPDEPLVGTLGLFKEQKRHDLLIQAAEEADVALAIAGDGPLRSELAARAGERVALLGFRADAPEVLADFDVFALSSDYEGMCLAVAEALAVGTPVVATAVGGVPQTVVDGETGLLVPPGDPMALARAIRRLIDDPDEAARLAAAGSELVRARYSIDEMVKATSAIYERMLAK